MRSRYSSCSTDRVVFPIIPGTGRTRKELRVRILFGRVMGMVPFGIMPSRTPLPDSTVFIFMVLYFSKYVFHGPDGGPTLELRGDARDCEVRRIPRQSISISGAGLKGEH